MLVEYNIPISPLNHSSKKKKVILLIIHDIRHGRKHFDLVVYTVSSLLDAVAADIISQLNHIQVCNLLLNVITKVFKLTSS